MPDRHEPDPRFVESLEWQLSRELRRNKVGPAERSAFRVLKIVGLMLGSVALGAAAMGASQQIEESWRRELLEARLEVQLRLAKQRVQTLLEAIGLTREQVEQGVRADRDLMYVELKVAQAEADARVTELELEEIRRSGREPLGELSSPLVDGRDFVSEKIQVRIQVARHLLDVVERTKETTRQRVEVGVVNKRELQAQDLVTMEAELQLDALAEQLEVRRQFLDSEISAVEAELKLLEVETHNRVVLLDRRRQYFLAELDHLRPAIEAGSLHPMAVAEMQTSVAEIEAELRLAEEEQRIVRRELERRAAQR